MNKPAENAEHDHIEVTGAEVLEAARRYVAANLSVIPISQGGSKSPVWQLLPRVRKPNGEMKHAWKPYQTRLPTDDEIVSWYSTWLTCGIAVVTGRVSGGLECIDFDSLDNVNAWKSTVSRQAPSLLGRLVLVRTPRPGLHVYFRSPKPGKSQKLASKLQINSETGLPETKTLIETKGEGGYCLVPPSPRYCHATLRPYVYDTTRDLTEVPTITAEERNILLESARAFDAMPVVNKQQAPKQRRPKRRTLRPDLPGDDFNMRADWGELLQEHGWTYMSQDGDGMAYWRRPGKSDGISATLNHAGIDLLHVFTSNATPLEADRSYSKFAFFTSMEHNGDYQAAANALRTAGYGRPMLPIGRRKRRKVTRRNGVKTRRRSRS